MGARSGSQNLLSSYQELREWRELAKIHIKMTTQPKPLSLMSEVCPLHPLTPELRQALLMDKSPDNQTYKPTGDKRKG